MILLSRVILESMPMAENISELARTDEKVSKISSHTLNLPPRRTSRLHGNIENSIALSIHPWNEITVRSAKNAQ
jgi:hypothetical protein